MNKFTKGPWSRDKYGQLLDKNGKNIMFRSVSIFCSGDPDRIAEAEANTDLASAAPELLQALQWVIEMHDSGQYPSLGLIAQAREAVAKATTPQKESV